MSTPKFAVYRKILDHQKVQRYLDDIITGKIQYGTPEQMACDMWARCLAGEFYPDKGEGVKA